MKKEDTLSLETENVDEDLLSISVSFKKKLKGVSIPGREGERSVIPNRGGGRSRNLKLCLKRGSKTVGIFPLYN